MFIRYNQGAHYYEYDTSAAQNGSGPWLILPLDGQLPGTLPPNIAYLDIENLFTQAQHINALNASLYLMDISQPVNLRVWRIMNQGQSLIFYTQNDGESGYINQATLDRSGGLNVRGGIGAAGVISTPQPIRGGTIESRGNQGLINSYDTNGPVDARSWAFNQPNNGVLNLTTYNDAGAGQANIVIFSRNGVTTFNNYTEHRTGAYFPVRSSNAGLLDCYEEGVWAPTLFSTGGGGGTTYAVQEGYYVRIGKLVFVQYSVQVSAANWVDGYLQLGGLPFGNAGTYATGTLDYWTVTANILDVKTHLAPGATTCYFIGRSVANLTGHDLVLTIPYYSTVGPWRGQFSYITAT